MAAALFQDLDYFRLLQKKRGAHFGNNPIVLGDQNIFILAFFKVFSKIVLHVCRADLHTAPPARWWLYCTTTIAILMAIQQPK
jgi:hypothetical protein